MNHTARRTLGAISAPDKPPTQTQQVLELLPEIEAAMARGIGQQRIVEALAEHGLTISVDRLRVILCRLRKKAKRPPDAKSQAAPAAKPVPTPQPAPSSAGFDFKAHRGCKPNW